VAVGAFDAAGQRGHSGTTCNVAVAVLTMLWEFEKWS
jgi:hypothetical protein